MLLDRFLPTAPVQVFKERYGHVRVPASFEFRVPEEEDEDDDSANDWCA